MKRIMIIGPTSVACWPEGTDAFGPSLAAHSEREVSFSGERVTNPQSGVEFYIVAFEDKGKVRRFEVRADAVRFREHTP